MGPASQRSLITHESVRSHVREIAASRTFRKAGGLCTLLEFLVDQALRNPGVALKEYHIATCALGKPATFDPQRDSIVRVQARRLRAKLCQFYESEGAAGAIRISLPLGRYVPDIRLHAERDCDAAGPREETAKAVAILPFKALGDTAAEGQLAHALIEELAHAMCESRNIRLLAWHSDALPPDRRRLTTIAEQMNLGAILEGSVYSSGDSVRVSVQLIRVPDGWLLWSQIYHRKGPPKIELQRELAAAIVKEMALPAGFSETAAHSSAQRHSAGQA